MVILLTLGHTSYPSKTSIREKIMVLTLHIMVSEAKPSLSLPGDYFTAKRGVQRQPKTSPRTYDIEPSLPMHFRHVQLSLSTTSRKNASPRFFFQINRL